MGLYQRIGVDDQYWLWTPIPGRREISTGIQVPLGCGGAGLYPIPVSVSLGDTVTLSTLR